MAPKNPIKGFVRRAKKALASSSEQPQQPPQEPQREPSPTNSFHSANEDSASADTDKLAEHVAATMEIDTEAEEVNQEDDIIEEVAALEEAELRQRREKRRREEKGKKVAVEENDLESNPLQFDDAFMVERYKHLTTKKFEQSRILDPTILDDLGVAADFYTLTAKSGFKQAFWEIDEPSYTRLTAEFLSSIVVEENDGTYTASFRLKGENYTCDEAMICEFFGLEEGGLDEPWISGNIWELITGLKDHKGQKKSAQIQHPALRMIQRIISLSFFARGETSNVVSNEELALLTHMLNRNPDYRPNLAFLLMQHWENIGKGTRAGHGAITLGSYVTHLAKKLEITSIRMKQSGKRFVLDADYLRTMRYVATQNRKSYWKWQALSFALPINQPIRLNDVKTFLLVPHEEEEGVLLQVRQQVQEEMRQPRGDGAGSSDAPRRRPQVWANLPESANLPGYEAFNMDSMRYYLEDIQKNQWSSTAYEEQMEERIFILENNVNNIRQDQTKANKMLTNISTRQEEMWAAQQAMQQRQEEMWAEEVKRNEQIAAMYGWFYPQFNPPPPPPQE